MSAIFSKIYIGKLKEVKIRNKFMHQRANSQGILYRSTPGSFTDPTLFSLESSLQIKSNPETSLSNKPGDKILTSRQLLCLLTLCLLHRSSKSFVQCMVKGYITQTHHRFSYCSPGCCCHWSGAYLWVLIHYFSKQSYTFLKMAFCAKMSFSLAVQHELIMYICVSFL